MSEEVSSKNTKKEILEAYERMKQQLEEQKADTTGTTKQDDKKSATGERAAQQTPDKTMKEIANLKISLSQSLDKVEEDLIEEHKKLTQLRDAIKAEEEKLQNTYQITAEADSLAALINAHKEKKKELEEEMNEKRKEWEKEKEQMEQKLKEEKERIQKDRQREEEEYKYSRDQKRKKEEDAFNEKMAKQEKELQEKREAFEREMQEREADIKAKEEELKDLRQKTEAFPKQLEEAVKLKENEVTNSLTTRFNHEKELHEKEYQSELKLKDQTIDTLKAKIKDQDDLVSQLYKKVENADKNVKDIVLRAIENSGRYPQYEKATEDKYNKSTEKNQSAE